MPGNCINRKKKVDTKRNESGAITSKSERSRKDAQAPIGMGATDTEGRLLASLFGAGPVGPYFDRCLDVPNGGVLLGLPGLLTMGLLRHTGTYFQLPPGYYGLESIFILLAFMALARLKTIECNPSQGVA